ncbi:centrosomal protein of 126 kDa [Hippoglossus stenolepis]|uniref:centrosomal protein of 126 kDa n=1 Tax=Hippoglossus stenolepis TaxID=195615 RepID=UPI001FAE9F54|nr:centrosomal protein of 126 kDa [Hippoglossus stenolepis]
MRLLHDNFFYNSNSRFGVAADLHDEKKLIAEEQKLCQARARKFCLETKRRRKALEERQKQRDEQEKQARETILQQRRERVQDATERFQRGHLPPSQRRRQTFTRDIPNIEDVLSQLQGPLGCYTQQSSYLSRNYNINRSCTPFPQAAHGQALSVVEVQTKMFLEERMAFSKNSAEDDATQEKQQDHSPQDSHVSDSCNSSKDSLENEDNNRGGNNLWNSRFYLLDSAKPPHTSDLTSSAMRLLDGNLAQSQKQQEPQQKTQDESEGPNNKMHVFNASWGFTSEKTQEPETQPAVNSNNLLSVCENSRTDPEHFETNSTRNNPKDNNNFMNTVTPDSTALDSSCPKPEALLDLRQQRVHDDRQLVHPSATEILLPAKNGNGKEISLGAPPKPNIFLNDSNIDNSSQYGTLRHTGKENHHLSSQKEPSASIINFNKFSNPEPVLQHARPSNIQSDALKCFKRPEEEEEKFPLSVGASRLMCNVRFIKGILKKTSGDAACAHGSGQGIFAEQVALAIKDSVELTRAKMKEVKSNATKKKVRWFDEVHVVKEQNKYRSSIPSQSKKNPEDHQQSLTTVSGAPKPGPSVTSAASTGYHFTKQAWADVGVQVSLHQERADEVKVLQSATRSIGPKVPWRERSARARAAPVSSRGRKGNVIRPQSATEVNRIAKTQGRNMVPRPPPRMEAVEEKMAYVAKTPYGVDHTCSVNSKHAGAGEQALRKDASGGSHHVIRTDSGVMQTPLPPSYTCPVSEGNAKSKLSSGHQETPSCGRRRGTVSNERGLCLNCTPTDEEISQLWHGVRSALAIKDEKAVPRYKAPESGRAVRKPCSEQCRQSPGSGNRRPPPPQPCQPSKQWTEPGRMFSNACNVALTHEGVGSAAQLHLAEVHAAGRLEDRDVVAAMETAQTQSPAATQQQQQQHKGFTTISLEEQKVLLSLEKLNHKLHYVQKHAGSNSGTRGLGLMDAPSTKEMKVTNPHKHRTSSAINPPWYLKKS